MPSRARDAADAYSDAADDITAGDAAINLTTTVGNITVDAQGNDTDIIFKGTDGTVDTTYLTLDGSAGGAATLNNGLTLADGNLVVAAGHGIDFSASTNVAGMSSELLDDYEEGNWTATLVGASGAPSTAVTVVGTYTKIGNTVRTNCYFYNVNTTGASGEIQVQGLPFAAGVSQLAGSYLHHSLSSSSGEGSTVYVSATGSTVRMFYNRNSVAWTGATIIAGTGKYLILNLVYRV